MNHIATELTRPGKTAPLPTYDISPRTLAHLNLGLFRYLRKLGTSRERICSALCLSTLEYEYIIHLE